MKTTRPLIRLETHKRTEPHKITQYDTKLHLYEDLTARDQPLEMSVEA